VEIGESWLEAYALINLSSLALARAEAAEALAYAEQGLALSGEIGSRPGEAYSLTFLGHAQVELGDLDAAEAAYRRALDIRRGLKQPNLATEPQAGLAQVALQRGEIPAAMEHVETILAFLDSEGGLQGAEEPLRVYLTCYQALRAGGERRANDILETAHEMLVEQAAKIDDEANRRRFLENIPHHRRIQMAWEAAQAQD
jgi:tetratricopeptide (TPR) repeat protein